MKQRLAVLVAATLVAGCKADPLLSGPDATSLRSALAAELPAYIRLNDLRVEASSNLGDRVDPLFKTRFSGSIELLADTFQQVGTEESAVIVSRLHAKGTARQLYGLAQSKWFAGAWKTTFVYENDPLPSLGRPRDFFGGGIVLVQGSSEETAFREDLRKRQDAIEQQQREASRREVDRIATESRIEAERLQAIANAEAERKRVQEQIEAQRRRAAEEEGERRLRIWITPGTVLNGKLYNGRTDIRLAFDAVDVAQKNLRGRADWDDAAVGSMPATYPFQGRWVGDTISASGTKKREGDQYQPQEVIKCNLTLTAGPAGRLEGTLCGEKIWFIR